MRIGNGVLQDFQDFRSAEALFALFGCNMLFQQDRHRTPVGRPPGLDSPEQMNGINGLDEGNIRKDQLELIGLEMPDEMPLHVGRHLRDLGGKFLRTVLRKEALSRPIGLHQAVDGMEFRNCRQAHS